MHLKKTQHFNSVKQSDERIAKSQEFDVLALELQHSKNMRKISG